MNSFFIILEALQPHRIIQLLCHKDKEREGSLLAYYKEIIFLLIA